MTGPYLSVVIPAFNESKYIGATMRALEVALRRADLTDAEVLLIDDGSTDDTARVAGEDFSLDLAVLTQPNSGRFVARHRGIERASGDFILFLGSRSELEPDSLRFWCSQRRDHPERLAWIGHTRTRVEGNTYAAFWETLARWVWPDYEGALTSYSATDFDSYPKGTGMVIAPRTDWLAAMELEANDPNGVPSRFRSDDTTVLRLMIDRVGEFWISPDLDFWYTASRASLRAFVGNALFRGTTAVDGYAGRPGRLGLAAWAVPLLAAVMVSGMAVGLARAPLMTASAVAAGVMVSWLVGVVMFRRGGRSVGQSVRLGLLLAPFLLGFVPGMWRGWALRLQRRRP